jgi:outer membrane receptor protein involved in Fe transport
LPPSRYPQRAGLHRLLQRLDRPSGPWFGGAELRWLGPYPLLADNSLRSSGYKEVNLDVGYKINDRMKIELSIFNLFNS